MLILAYTPIDLSTFNINSTFGSIQSPYNVFVFVINLLMYIGWAGVYLGLAYVIMVLIYSLFNSDSKEVFTKVQDAFFKVISIVILGLLLLSAGFILKFVATTLGYGTINLEVPSVFK